MTSGPPPLPSSPPIRFSYVESGDLLLEGREQATPSRPFRWGAWPAILLAIVVLTIFKAASERSYSGGMNLKDVVITIGLVVFLVALLVLVKYSRFVTLPLYRRVYRKRTGRDESKIVCELGDVALFASTEGGAAAHYPWNTIVRVIERPQGLLVYTGPAIFFWFPKTAFASENDFAAAKRLLESKVTDFRKSN
jgi:hypothetical protein